MAVSAAARVSACQMSRKSDFTVGPMDFGNLFSTLAVLWTQHLWCRVPGKTSSSAFQKP
jgi:hypothetical protein